MAEIVTGAMGTLLPKLANLIKEEYSLQKKVKAEVLFLEAELKSMEAALIKVSEAPIDQPPDVQVKLWTREVRELSYDLEDNIDKFMVRVGDGKPHSFKGFIDRSLNLLTRGRIKHKIGLDIQKIKIGIKDVSERRDRYKVDLVPSKKPVGRSIDSLRMSALYRKATELVGAEEKSLDLVKMLMEGNQTSTKQPVVLSIVGFGGLGKTTLANLVYQKIKGQFHCGAFVCVSQNPDVVRIFKEMLYDLDGVKFKYREINQGTWSERQLIDELRKFLKDKRFFIVIDDIWNTFVWESIQYALMENECGSRIITTTRILDVARQVGSVYKLEPLSPADSTKLFCQRIFGSEEKCPNNLVGVADQILQKCGGVPLAIITMASMLANKTGNEINTHNYWSNVYQSMGSGVDGGSNDVKNMRRILSVSYYDLPSHLKTCLLYLSLFPEDYNIEIGGLIWKWIGEGFVREQRGRTLYEVGENYIQELVNRSMIQPVHIGHDGKTVSCRIHDTILDLISFLSNEEHFLTKVGGQQPISFDLPKNIRRLSLQISEEEEVNQLATMSFSQVRSLTVSTDAFQLMPSLSSFLVLRVLDLSNCDQVKNHHLRDICNMFHLRYLSLHGQIITEIPREIQNLQFLQVLDIRYSWNIEMMPSTFIHLRQLLRLGVYYRVRLPDGFGKLMSLQEVEGTIAIESPSMLRDLGCLTELRTTLAIEFCDWDESYEEPFIQCLSNLVNLKSMKIRGIMMSSLYSERDNLYPGPQKLCSIDMEKDNIITAVPRWMSSLCFLSTINISLLTLGEQDIQVLGSIPSLCHFSMYVKETTQDRYERLVIGKCYPFQCLAKLKIDYSTMEVVFAPGGMQNLKELDLVFGVTEVMNKFGDCNLGLEHLLSLEHVSLEISVDNTTPKEVEAVEDEIREALDMNPGKPTLTIERMTVQRRIKAAVHVQRAAFAFLDAARKK